jgi:hypothetical protein
MTYIVGMTWDIPAWWELERFPNDTYTLTRVDGIQLGSYKTGMGFWGWCVIKGGEHFEEAFDEALIETDEDGVETKLPKITEGAMQYPDPATFLGDLDEFYPCET